MNSSQVDTDREESPQEDTQRRTGARSKSGPRLAFESLLIVLSVLLAFALTSWGDRRAERELASAALTNFRSEIEGNLRQLERVQPTHAAFAKRLAAAASESSSEAGIAAIDEFRRTMPEVEQFMPSLREAAWETALSTGALRLFDYDVAALLSETYLVQRATMARVALLEERVMNTSSFDPAIREHMLRVHDELVRSLAGQEEHLIQVYVNALENMER